MAKVDWGEVKDRFKKAMDKGVKVLKEGGEGVGYVAGQTAHMIQLEFEVHQLKVRIAALFHELGEVVYKAKDGKGASSNSAREIRSDLDLLHLSLKKKQAEIKRTQLARTPEKKSKKK